MSDPSDPADDLPQIVGATNDELPANMRDVSHVIAFDLREEEQTVDPAKMKVRWVLTVVTGKRAEELDARIDAWHIKALQWLRDHPREAGKVHTESRDNAH
ncbi:MAG: hypothetical protein JO016_02390 [Actinobacteria bacterium]|nr:hypothetical protein [Actinomycetota bacterium]